MTLIQGAGVHSPCSRVATYSAPPRAKPPTPLKNSRSSSTERIWRAGSATTSASCGECRPRPLPVQLIARTQQPRRPDTARRRLYEYCALPSKNVKIGAQSEYCACRRFSVALSRVAVPAHQCFERSLKARQIGGRMLVQDHEIDE